MVSVLAKKRGNTALKLAEATDEPGWEDLDNLSFDELVELAERHKQTLTSGTKADIESIAHLHAKDLLPDTSSTEADWPQVLQYVQQMLEDGQLDSLTVEEIHETNGSAPGFQRIKHDKITAKHYGDSGMLMESVRYYPSGTKVKLFHSVFKDPEQWTQATKGQEFFAGLVDFIKKKFDPTLFLSESEQYIADRISGSVPIRPLESENKVLDNILINGEDVQDIIAKQDPSVDARVDMLSEIADIDLITAYFSTQFRETTQGRKLSRHGLFGRKKRFDSRDYRREVFEDILLRVDKKFFRDLVDHGVISTSGVVMDEKAFRVFYDGDCDQAKLLDLIGISGDNVDRQDYFTSFDLNLGNVMVAERDGTNKYTSIDFEHAQNDSLESLLFRRWAQSGVYDHKGSSKTLENGKTAEEQLLDSAYATLETIARVEDTVPISKDEFKDQFAMQKKKQLLRLARRYRSFEQTDADPEQMRDHSRYFYTLFVYELAKEGKIVGVDDTQLEYLDGLFESPLSPEEMADIAERHNPSFSSQEEINPLGLKDVASKNQAMIEQYKQVKRFNRMRRIAVPIVLVAALVGGAVAAKLGYDYSEDAAKARQEMIAKASFDGRLKTLYKIDKTQMGSMDALAQREIRGLEEKFGDPKTARAFFVDPICTYEAMQETGSTDWDDLKKYFDKEFSAYLKATNYEGKYPCSGVMFGLDYDKGYIDSFVYHTTAKDVNGWIAKKEAEGKAAYDAKKAEDANNNCRQIQSPMGAPLGEICPKFDVMNMDLKAN